MRQPLSRTAFVLLLTFSIASHGSSLAIAQPVVAEAQINFDIPAQPLSRALIAYGAATGLDVFYNAAMAEQQKSGRVTGLLTPTTALQILLHGTGYVAKSTGPGAFTIAPAAPLSTGPSSLTPADRRRFEPYFAAIQARISAVLCQNPEPLSARRDVLFQIWLTSTGGIAQVDVVGDDGEPASDQGLATFFRNVALGAPPPGLPQPINLVVLQPSVISKACTPSSGQQGTGQ